MKTYYTVAVRRKNTKLFDICEDVSRCDLEVALNHIRVLISQCSRTYEDIRLYQDVDFQTKVDILPYWYCVNQSPKETNSDAK